MKASEEPRVVLVIDDDAAVLNSLKFALEVEGYAVHVSANGSELLDDGAVSATCLVVDLNLPSGDGLDLIARLGGGRPDRPAILITSDPTPSVRQRAAAAGIPIVEKPLLGNALLEAVARAFDRQA